MVVSLLRGVRKGAPVPEVLRDFTIEDFTNADSLFDNYCEFTK